MGFKALSLAGRAPAEACAHRLRNRAAGAFSLIEVVMALGVVSFAFLSIFGLLPIGMTTFRAAIDCSVATRISQEIVNEAQQTDFNTLLASQQNRMPRFFDVDGGELKAAPGVTPPGAIYDVNVRISSAPVVLPGAAAVANEDLATVTVQIANNPGRQPLAMDSTNLWTATRGVSMTTDSTVIAGYLATVGSGN